ncbi:enoyl-CoA hydratase-related protein [Streptomyces chartreusis]|uniref:enoyl-CoA hydratase-related protein n=1 Tax=Streptomyces chartreusis TaxID=1969 RepID=UPI0036B46850
MSAAIGRLVFVNPGRRNALSSQMMLDSAVALNRFASDPEVRAVIVSGHGTTFTAGADLTEMADTDSSEHGDATERGTDRPTTPDAAAALFRSLDGFDRPIIAMIRGYCLGAGVAVALRADLRVATPQSAFGIPAARVGIGYPLPEVESLVAAVGPSAAADLLFTARRIDGAEAHRLGLVTRLVDDTDLDAVTTSIGEAIAANAPLSIRAAKAAIATIGSDQPDLRHRAEQLLQICANSVDAREGARAILQKRPPRFLGR